MHVENNARTVGSASPGKTQSARVLFMERALKLQAPLRGLPWALMICGSSSDLKGSGKRLGKVSEVESTLRIELTPSDVCAIVDFAIQHGLVNTIPNLDPLPKAAPDLSA